ncbi:MAG: hypothetical protein P9X24_17730 [Candidatus Hatepunaea meridiana]|nr:hypothetical protein [Candidatus Hatepunaea meridiana]
MKIKISITEINQFLKGSDVSRHINIETTDEKSIAITFDMQFASFEMKVIEVYNTEGRICIRLAPDQLHSLLSQLKVKDEYVDQIQFEEEAVYYKLPPPALKVIEDWNFVIEDDLITLEVVFA